MARPPRIQIPGGIYHVFTRGVDRRDIYLEWRDRERFEWLLADVLGRHAWSCLSFCQMTNHYHVVVETKLPDLAAGIKRLNQCYAQSFNRRHGRKGHLFESRYDSVVVEDQAHLLTVLAYVALNPVEAGICADPLDWRWSSFAQTVRDGGRGRVRTDRVLTLLGRTPEEAARRLERFVRERMPRPGRHSSCWGSDPGATSGPSGPSSRAASGGPA